MAKKKSAKKKPLRLNKFFIIIFGLAIVMALTIEVSSQLSDSHSQRNSYHQDSQDPKEEVQEIRISTFLRSELLKDPKGKLASFTEIFSGGGWKDNNKSTIYQDFVNRIISFPPKYSLKEIPLEASSFPLQDLFSSSDGQECLESNHKCLLLSGGKIYLADNISGKKQEVPLIFSVEAIGKTENFWLLANSQTEAHKFAAAIYKFDGRDLERLVEQGFYESDYSGKFLLGGKDNDFLAGFYGEGSKVLRFIKEGKGRLKAWDVSFWFNTKLAQGIAGAGIENLLILNTEAGYIFYSQAPPLFLLANSNFLFDLTDELDLKKFQKIIVQRVGTNKFLIIAYENGQRKLYEFKNFGFDKSTRVSFVSLDLIGNTNQKGNIVSAAILEYLGSKKGGEWQFYFSVDGGETWRETELGKTIYFEPVSVQALDFRWRVDFIPTFDSDSSDNFHSPFLYQLRLSYGEE